VKSCPFIRACSSRFEHFFWRHGYNLVIAVLHLAGVASLLGLLVYNYQGETSPFERVRDMGKIKGAVRSCKITAKGLRLKESNASATITNVETARDGNGFRIKGIFNATGKAPCKNPVAIVAGYDKNGKIQAVTTLSLTNDGTFRGTPLRQVDAGKSQGFSLLLRNETGTIESVKVFPSFECD
jgi:hypothetical protein